MSKAIFKAYTTNQMKLLPLSYEVKIPAGHLVRQVNAAIEALDLDILLAQYEGGCTSSYHPKMMLKVLAYAYCKKIYTSLKIAEENVYFMWLSKEQTADERRDRRNIHGSGGTVGGEFDRLPSSGV